MNFFEDLFKTEEERNNEAQERGSTANALEEFFEMSCPWTSQEEKNSFMNGCNNPKSTSSSEQLQESREESVSAVSASDTADYYNDEYYSYQNNNSGNNDTDEIITPPEPEIEPTYKYSKYSYKKGEGFNFTISRTTIRVGTKEQNDYYLRMMDYIKEEELYDEDEDEADSEEQQALAEITGKLESGGLLNVLSAALSMATLKNKNNS